MKYGIRVKVGVVRSGQPSWEWRWLKPTIGPRYAWDSEKYAHRMMAMCYGGQTGVRVQKIEDE